MFFSQMVSKKSQEINIFPYFSIFFVDFKLIYFCFSNFSTAQRDYYESIPENDYLLNNDNDFIHFLL